MSFWACLRMSCNPQVVGDQKANGTSSHPMWRFQEQLLLITLRVIIHRPVYRRRGFRNTESLDPDLTS